MNSNFSFIQPSFPQIFSDAADAEELAIIKPKLSAISSRSALELGIKWLYDNDSSLVRPYDSNIGTLMFEPSFKNLIKPSIFSQLNIIRKTGNAAAHGSSISQYQSIASLKALFCFCRYLAVYYAKDKPKATIFDESLIPAGDEEKISKKDVENLVDEKAKLIEELRVARVKAEKLERESENARNERQLLLDEITKRKEERTKEVKEEIEIPILLSEAETRKLYIDLSLKEAGWSDLKESREIEYEVTGMPTNTNPSGIGYADYVLWGDNGLPLAVIEAKKTMSNARSGQHQAELYADCLQEMHGQRPIIFFTNGFETFIWDDTFYTDRKVHGFYTKEELQLLVDRRKSRLDLRNFKVNMNIAGRPYQLEAVQRVAENLVVSNSNGQITGYRRESLLVMATGSGKTRTAGAIVDMLTKCNWAKRVLFLADRNVLVTQAKNAFNDYLPHLTSIDLTKEKEDNGTRLVFSTYPTIMNKIDSLRNNNERFYGVGHFDLIIIDEAHRSIYQKYRAIFEYFDALLIGLTATPKKEVDHDTYGLFGIEDDNPTFAYELDDAVNDGYLVPPRVISVPIKFPLEGIKYKDLSEKEQLEFEEKFYDDETGEIPEEITGSSIHQWVFNTDTVDKVLEYLLENGVKVEGGDKIGKTIIFAKNHQHAEFIQERFNKNYPEYSSKFLRVIDNYESKAQDLLEKFKDEYNEVDPQIAVSVDMMDTGVDAPRVVNLVFFKLVKSRSKFWQMIGRGTRLCPDLFAPGEDKKFFIIFDFCENFEFFDQHPKGIEGNSIVSLTQKTFELKLEIAQLIRENINRKQEEENLANDYILELNTLVKELDKDRFVVKKELEYVAKFSNTKSWENLSKGDIIDIDTHLAQLIIPKNSDDEYAKRFDVFMLTYMLTLIMGKSTLLKYINNIKLTSNQLLKKVNIPEIKKQEPLLKEIIRDDFWEDVNLEILENIRLSLRGLIKFLDKEYRPIVVTHFEDELGSSNVNEHPDIGKYSSLHNYKIRIEKYIKKNRNHVAIHKINTNKQITKKDLEELEHMLFENDELGTKEDYIKEYGEQPLGIFVRSILGLNLNSANEAFAEFIQAGNLTGDQITFIRTIISYLAQNGVIEKEMLFEPPFTNLNDQGIAGVFDDKELAEVISIIDTINSHAVAV